MIILAGPSAWPVEVGVLKDLPVPVLLGRDWLGFDRLHAATLQPVSLRGSRRRKRPMRGARQRPVLLASDSGRDGESPQHRPNLFLDLYPQMTGGGSFAKEQCEDDRLKAPAKSIAHEHFLLCSRVDIPAEILTDQGTPFMSWQMADLCTLLKVKQLRTSVYHPQTDGLVQGSATFNIKKAILAPFPLNKIATKYLMPK